MCELTTFWKLIAFDGIGSCALQIHEGWFKEVGASVAARKEAEAIERASIEAARSSGRSVSATT